MIQFFVIFTQFEKSIRVIMSILEKDGVKASVYHDWSSIVDFKSQNKKVIILSSAQPTFRTGFEFHIEYYYDGAIAW
jgi:hypothetical protein